MYKYPKWPTKTINKMYYVYKMGMLILMKKNNVHNILSATIEAFCMLSNNYVNN